MPWPIVMDDLVAIPGTSEAVVLFNYIASNPPWRPFENLVCAGERGR
jgi:hypothetical protein